MSPGNGAPTTSAEVRLLEDISDLRHRVRARHREHALWAALVGLVALGGAAVFLLAPQIRAMSCQQLDPGAVVCSSGQRSFGLWWYWPLAASAAVISAFVRRHRRGTWRMTSTGWLIAVLVLIFVLPTAVSLLAVIMPPVGYPLAAAGALAGLAASRRSVVGVAAALGAAAAVLFIEFALTGQAMDDVGHGLLTDNLGLALSSLLVGAVALVTAGTWAVGQRR